MKFVLVILAVLSLTPSAESMELYKCYEPSGKSLILNDDFSMSNEWEEDKLTTNLSFVGEKNGDFDIVFRNKSGIAGSVKLEGGYVIKLPVGRSGKDISFLAVNPKLNTSALYLISADNDGRKNLMMHMSRANEFMVSGALFTAYCE